MWVEEKTYEYEHIGTKKRARGKNKVLEQCSFCHRTDAIEIISFMFDKIVIALFSLHPRTRAYSVNCILCCSP